MNGQAEITIQILEDMLWACVIDYGGSWYNLFPFFEFAYYNSYQSSIGIELFKALNGRRCQSPSG